MPLATRFRRSTPPPVHGDASPASALVVFAALDGWHLASDAGPALEFRAAMAALERSGVPVVVWSGHTRAEIELARQQMDNRTPFVSEHGGALFLPSGYFPFPIDAGRQVPGYDVIEFGTRYDDLVRTLHEAAQAVHVQVATLSDMTIDEVAEDFHLPLPEARLATLREYTELFTVLEGAPASRGRLFRALHARGMTCSHGDRYDLLTGVSDRTAALQTVHRLLQRVFGRVVRIGIGSRAEDLPVLAQADIRILIKDEDTSLTAHMRAQMPTAHVMEQPGVDGWLEALSRLAASLPRPKA